MADYLADVIRMAFPTLLQVFGGVGKPPVGFYSDLRRVVSASVGGVVRIPEADGCGIGATLQVLLDEVGEGADERYGKAFSPTLLFVVPCLAVTFFGCAGE